MPFFTVGLFINMSISLLICRSFTLSDKSIGDASILVLKTYICFSATDLISLSSKQSKEELFKREGGHIKETECANRQIAGRTQQEWKLDNPEQAREYYERGKARARAYYHKHKEEIIEKRCLNEEKIIEQRLLKVECPFCKR